MRAWRGGLDKASKGGHDAATATDAQAVPEASEQAQGNAQSHSGRNERRIREHNPSMALAISPLWRIPDQPGL